MTNALDLPPTFLHLRSGSAPKLGQHSDGQIHYELLTDRQNKELFIRLTANDSGGYFSREAIPFSRIRAAVAEINEGQGFASKTFFSLFIGRSINNSGFISCVLRALGLIAAVPDNAHLHQLAGNWSEWERTCLDLPGEPIRRDDAPEPLTPPPKTGKKEGRARHKVGADGAGLDAQANDEGRIDANLS